MLLFLRGLGAQKSAVADDEVGLRVPPEVFLQPYLHLFLPCRAFRTQAGVVEECIRLRVHAAFEVHVVAD
jgi:hypothetical protein